MDLLEQREQRCGLDYIRALEEERRKIQVFRRELPLCLQLVTQAIESVREQIGEEERVQNGPVLEEFIPLKPCFTSTEEEVEEKSPVPAIGADMKPDWLRSVQLWNQEPATTLKAEPPKKPIAVNVNKVGGAFQPFDREKRRPAGAAAASSAAAAAAAGAAAATPSPTSSGGGSGGGRDGNSSSSIGGGDKEKEREGQSQSHRKTRRCWSPELHRRFLNALQQLGGSHVATPKQIRELMKVDGLTNDEVKSHLQKYRLHSRRPSTAGQSSSSTPAAAPQFMLVGGILVPPPSADYAAATAGAPAAAHPQQKQHQVRKQMPREDTSTSDEEEATISASPSTSASSQTTTAAPPF